MEFVNLLILCLLFIVVDSPYLAIMGKYWGNSVAKIQGHDMVVDYRAAAVAYIFLAIGMKYLVLSRDENNIFYAGLFGLTTYGVFNFTNAALFHDYDMRVATIDTIWGIIACINVYMVAMYINI